MKLYRGSPVRGITEFTTENKRFDSLVEGNGVYLTPDYRVARSYTGSQGSVYICSLKTQAIFDATVEDDFRYLFSQIKKKFHIDILTLEGSEGLIRFFISGDYTITDDDGNCGIGWQVRSILLNDEDLVTKKGSDEIIFNIEEYIKDYFAQHSVLKYIDKTLGLVFVVRDPNMIKIEKEIEVPSDEDESLL